MSNPVLGSSSASTSSAEQVNPILLDLEIGKPSLQEIEKPLNPPLLEDPLASNLLSDAQTSYPYITYDVVTEYEWDAGVVQLPTAESSTTSGSGLQSVAPYAGRNPSSIIQAANPSGRKRVKFRIARLIIQPVAPDPTPVNSNEILLNAKLKIFAPKVQADGVSLMFEMEGEYLYALTRPYYTDDTLLAGSTQADNLTADDNAYGPDNFEAGMI